MERITRVEKPSVLYHDRKNGDYLFMIVHTPVMLKEVKALLLAGKGDSVFVDATLGEGGYGEALLSEFPGLVYAGIEVDPAILYVAKERLGRFGGRVRFYNMWFTEFFERYTELCSETPDRILFDLGISRFHYESSGRGFSFAKDEPLDMRLDKNAPVSAETLVNESDERELARIFFAYGEERFGNRIAAAISAERKKERITLANRLAKIVESAIPSKYRYSGHINPATRVFQALRIAVNNELENLEEGLRSAFGVLAPGGRIGVIAYHSLEDRIVKRFFNEKKSGCTCPPDWPICKCGGKPELSLVTKKPVTPGEDEKSDNRASRSAKLRVAEKLGPSEGVAA